QINPIWLWGPYHVASSTNGAQPDWYLGWLIGAMRLVPSFDLTIGGATVIPNPFWGGVAFPALVFGVIALWPWLERAVTRDPRPHNLLDRPSEAPVRTAFGCGLLTFVLVPFLAGSADRVDVFLGLDYQRQIYVYRVLVFVAPIVVAILVYRLLVGLRRADEIEADRERALAEPRSGS
ncbi:MAG TPA: hypothetical protein VFM41_07730, partial [Gaiella sp.]|nr:hypothetical protein [Gaiella sp.]